MSRVSWLAPPVKPGASDAIVMPSSAPIVRNRPGASMARSGNAARNALYPYPLMPTDQPWSEPDITAQQPHNLRRPRTSLPMFARIPTIQTPGGPVIDWLSLLQALYDELLYHVDHKANFVQQPLTITTVATTVRPEEPRRYLLIQNNDTADNLLIGFGQGPTTVNGVLLLPGQFYEPITIPQNEIILAAATNTVNGTLVYAN